MGGPGTKYGSAPFVGITETNPGAPTMAVPFKALGSMLRKYYRDNLGTGTEQLPASIVLALKQLSTLDDNPPRKPPERERRGESSDL
jgi:hypothetical protein